MKKYLTKIIIWISLLWLNLLNVFGITLQVPTPSGQEDIVVTWPTQVESDESTVFDIIQIVNDYLWFAIAWVAMVLLVVAGLKLITASGDKEQMTKANNMVIGSMIAIFVSILSYAIVKLVVNLF